MASHVSNQSPSLSWKEEFLEGWRRFNNHNYLLRSYVCLLTWKAKSTIQVGLKSTGSSRRSKWQRRERTGKQQV